MSREQDAYKKIRENYKNSVLEAGQVPPKPTFKKFKPNYTAAFFWTAIVSALSSTMFIFGLVYYIQSTGFLDGLDKRNKQIVLQLRQQLDEQSNVIEQMIEENKKILKYLELWTPLKCQKQFPDEKWRIPGYGLPEKIPLKKYNSEVLICK